MRDVKSLCSGFSCAQAIQAIAEEERVQLFVPVSIAQFSVYEALAAQRMAKLGCGVCTLDAASVALLNDKIKFSRLAERIGVAVPPSFSVTSRRELLDLNSRCPRSCRAAAAQLPSSCMHPQDRMPAAGPAKELQAMSMQQTRPLQRTSALES